MKLAIETPISQLALSSYADFDFIIAPFLQDPTYKAFFKASKRFKILDNGAYEEQLVVEELVSLAKELSVNVIVTPDYVGKRKETVILADVFGSWFHQEGYQAMAVVQGQDMFDFFACLKELEGVKLDWLGIPLRPFGSVWEEAEENRARFVSEMQLESCCSLHLLGLSSLAALSLYKNLSIQSVDTSLPCLAALEDQTIERYKKTSRKLDFFVEMTPLQVQLAFYNIGCLKTLCHEIR